MQNNRYNNFGLPGNEKAHINCTEQALLSVEFKIYKSMTKSVAEWFYNKHVRNGNLPEVKFINYGDTELVYLLTYGDKRYTMLFGQPIVKEGGIIREYELLKKYYYQDKSTVVAPIEYYRVSQSYFNKRKDWFKTFNKEVYITPYFMQARCIASQEDGFGIYVPEPKYHFEKFSEKECEIVCACMIAKLISLYDEGSKCGISACKLGDGDFMLDKEWNRQNISKDDTLKHMRLNAARDEINCSLEEYIALLSKEFPMRTYYTDEENRDRSILINHKAQIGMSESAIKKGIEWGMELRRIHGGSAGLDFGSKLRGDDKTGKSVSKNDGKDGK